MITLLFINLKMWIWLDIMDINTASLFNLTTGTTVKENLNSFTFQIQPGSLSRMDKSFPTNGMHSHNFYELCFVVSGTGEYIHGKEQFILCEYDVFIANPNVKHEIRLLKDASGKYINKLNLVFFIIEIIPSGNTPPKPQICYEEKVLTSFILNHSAHRKSCSHLLSYLDFLQNYTVINKGSGFGVYHMVRNMAFDGILCLTEHTEKQRLVDTQRENNFHLALLFIESNLNRRLHISEIASHIFTSKRNLHYMFKDYLNKTVNDYINERKMSAAALYLRMKYRAGDVCLLVGINDLAQFSRLFKKYYKVSPKKYQVR